MEKIIKTNNNIFNQKKYISSKIVVKTTLETNRKNKKQSNFENNEKNIKQNKIFDFHKLKKTKLQTTSVDKDKIKIIKPTGTSRNTRDVGKTKDRGNARLNIRKHKKTKDKIEQNKKKFGVQIKNNNYKVNPKSQYKKSNNKKTSKNKKNNRNKKKKKINFENIIIKFYKPNNPSFRIKRKNKSKNVFDYKNIKLLRNYINNQGKILPRYITKLNARKQRKFSNAIKTARILGLLPFVNQ